MENKLQTRKFKTYIIDLHAIITYVLNIDLNNYVKCILLSFGSVLNYLICI